MAVSVDPATITKCKPLKQVVVSSEIPRYHELGLGRGVNVAESDMWKSKTPYLVREAFEENIIGTQE